MESVVQSTKKNFVESEASHKKPYTSGTSKCVAQRASTGDYLFTIFLEMQSLALIGFFFVFFLNLHTQQVVYVRLFPH